MFSCSRITDFSSKRNICLLLPSHKLHTILGGLWIKAVLMKSALISVRLYKFFTHLKIQTGKIQTCPLNMSRAVLFGQKMNPITCVILDFWKCRDSYLVSKWYPKKGIVSLLSFVEVCKENIKNSVKTRHTYPRNSKLGYGMNSI